MEPAFRSDSAPIPGLAGARSIRVQGRVSHRDAARLLEVLLGEVERTSARRLVVDLSGLESIDTAGAAVLVEALRASHKLEIRMVLCAPSGSVLQMFRLAGFEEVLDHCCGGPEEARRRLKG